MHLLLSRRASAHGDNNNNNNNIYIYIYMYVCMNKIYIHKKDKIGNGLYFAIKADNVI